MNKTAPPLLLFSLLIVMLSSCKNAPVACFTILTNADSIRVGHPVQFDPACSSDATQYFWDFGNGQTSALSSVVQTTYDSATTYSISLVVEGSGKSASITKNIVVLP
jgi:PKD repeat protein